MKENEDKDEADYNERLKLQHKITKINLLIPQVVDGYCNIRKIPYNYMSTVEYRVTRNYNGRILRRCSDGGRGFQTGGNVLPIGRNPFYDWKILNSNEKSGVQKVRNWSDCRMPQNSERISQPSWELTS
jgi:hypothetical protein